MNIGVASIGEVAIAGRLVAVGSRLVAVGGTLVHIGRRLIAVGARLVAVGERLIVFGQALAGFETIFDRRGVDREVPLGFVRCREGPVGLWIGHYGSPSG